MLLQGKGPWCYDEGEGIAVSFVKRIEEIF
jgi:hypothetical protein